MIKLIFALMLLSSAAYAQTEKDTVMLDTAGVEKMNRMPVDTSHHTMPVAPLQQDTTIKKPEDDADPVRRRDD